MPITKAQALSVGKTSPTIQAINDLRKQHRLPALRQNAELQSSATSKAKDMVANSIWSHRNSLNEPPEVTISQHGYNYALAGENLAKGYIIADDTLKAWMGSPTHRANLLGAYQDIGVAVQTYASGASLIVAHFGSPKQNALATPSSLLIATPSLAALGVRRQRRS